ncbi:divalent-cation tolerance protein CutA [Bdellovibrio reynosensis]|uniref:Divalent-cation tolerance protein CutA n=1 Tax=Bdellovibrio reynosensis TaxID=2835041 RepID=A0ABY4CEG4_9BACT|nr:divalent-cation tolerance protein CutA [Bdellovibrio reynosensis]UOF02849.1 divalent-cation tolerance protein CutA [Bdellovibrio reynosensis]
MVLLYIPCPDKKVAQNIAKTLLEEKLIGCANIIPGMESMYWWDGKIETSSEYILILKTLATPDAQEILRKRVLELHPYEVPCVMTLDVLGINESYKRWLESSMK